MEGVEVSNLERIGIPDAPRDITSKFGMKDTDVETVQPDSNDYMRQMLVG